MSCPQAAPSHRPQHYHHHSHSAHAAPAFTKAFIAAAIINLIFVVVEVIYALSAQSMSLLADAGHNFSDVIGLALSALAMWLLKKPSTTKYSYGFKRLTIMAALLNAVLLVITTVVIILESINKLLHPLVMQVNVIMAVAAVGIVVNGGTELFFMRGQEDLNVKSVYLHLAYDALLALGVVVTAALISWTHYLWLDPVVAIVIAIIIFYGTLQLLRQSLALSLDAVPADIDPAQVNAYLQQLPIVTEVHHLHIWALSTRQVALTAHLVVPSGTLDDQTRKNICRELTQKFKIQHITLQVEHGSPDAVCEPC